VQLIREVEIWVPHRISGFFQIEDQSEFRQKGEYEKIGSRGGGPALTAYGKTRIIIKELGPVAKFSYRIFLNNEDKTEVAKTSNTVIEILRDRIPNNISFDVYHSFDLPQGCGYGSSGCGAVGLAMGLSTIFNLGLSLLEIGKIAHYAEVTNYTGLGTVGGQIYGGLSISIEPGFPFNLDFVPIPPNLKVVTASWGAISTKHILTDPDHRKRIIASGRKAIQLMKNFYSPRHYMDVCKSYINDVELLRILNLQNLEKCICQLNQLNIYGASMNQLGESLFCFCESNQVNDIIAIINSFKPKFGPYILDICFKGAFIYQIQ
jgi:pantoate kinase